MTSEEMRKTICRPGYKFENIAKNVDEPDWRLVFDMTQELIFGYPIEELMAKQYKKNRV